MSDFIERYIYKPGLSDVMIEVSILKRSGKAVRIKILNNGRMKVVILPLAESQEKPKSMGLEELKAHKELEV